MSLLFFKIYNMNYAKANLNNSQSNLKRLFLSLIAISLMFSVFNACPVSAKTKVTSKTAKKTVVAKKAVKTKSKALKTTMKWDTSGVKALGSMASFDYNYSIRDSFVKKVENYAKRKHIKVITASVINHMTE